MSYLYIYGACSVTQTLPSCTAKWQCWFPPGRYRGHPGGKATGTRLNNRSKDSNFPVKSTNKRTISHPLWNDSIGVSLIHERERESQTVWRNDFIALMDLEQRVYYHFDSSPHKQNGRLFADISTCIFVNKKFCISMKISVKFVPRGPIDNKPALV